MSIEEFLESLGNTSEEVANSLEQMGIKGECYNGEYCPVTKAIYQKFPKMSRGLKTVYSITYPRYIDSIYGKLYIEGSNSVIITWDDIQTLDPDCPKAIADFVRNFDNRKYPNLIGKSQAEFREEVLARLTKEEKMALGL